jgi:hypothetical protein
LKEEGEGRRGRREEEGGKREEGRGKREEGRGKRKEGGGKMEEGRGRREDGRGRREEAPSQVSVNRCWMYFSNTGAHEKREDERTWGPNKTSMLL